jgi:hypothetical protein
MSHKIEQFNDKNYITDTTGLTSPVKLVFKIHILQCLRNQIYNLKIFK